MRETLFSPTPSQTPSISSKHPALWGRRSRSNRLTSLPSPQREHTERTHRSRCRQKRQAQIDSSNRIQRTSRQGISYAAKCLQKRKNRLQKSAQFARWAATEAPIGADIGPLLHESVRDQIRENDAVWPTGQEPAPRPG